MIQISVSILKEKVVCCFSSDFNAIKSSKVCSGVVDGTRAQSQVFDILEEGHCVVFVKAETKFQWHNIK